MLLTTSTVIGNYTTYDPLILRKIEEKSPSAFGVQQYVTASLLDKYSQNKICNIPDCYVIISISIIHV